MVKVDIITGFLGAGKTTLLNKLLGECWQGERPVVIENEFGNVSIDTALIARPDLQVKTIASGCICCTLKVGFVQGVMEVVQAYHPTRIVVEPTGLADLEDLLAACALAAERVPLVVNSLITVVNAKTLPALLSAGGSFFRRQIAEARIVVLSRIQECTPEQRKSAETLIRDRNPHCPIVAEEWSALDSLALTAAAEEAAVHDAARQECHVHHYHHHDAEAFTALPFYPCRRFAQEELQMLLQRLGDGSLGRVFRAKGFLTLTDGTRVLAEYTYGQSAQTVTTSPVSDRFVVIGQNLAESALRS